MIRQLTTDEWRGWILHYYEQHYPAGTTARGVATMTEDERQGYQMRADYLASAVDSMEEV